jgi:hypothetical protein
MVDIQKKPPSAPTSPFKQAVKVKQVIGSSYNDYFAHKHTKCEYAIKMIMKWAEMESEIITFFPTTLMLLHRFGVKIWYFQYIKLDASNVYNIYIGALENRMI